MSIAMPWAYIGKVAVLILVELAYLTISAIVELYWPGVYEFIVDGAVIFGLVWSIFWRNPEDRP